MTARSNQAGFSPIKIVLLILLIIGLAAGGYFAYSKFFATKPAQVQVSNTNPFIPKELADIAVGANASTFLIFNNDQNFQSLLPSASYFDVYKNLKTIILVLPSQDPNSLKVYLSFQDEQTAKTAQSWILQQSKSTMPPNADVTVQGNLLILSGNINSTALTGKFIDNPNLEKISNFSGSQLVGYLNYQDNIELTYGLYSMVNVIFSTIAMQDNLQGFLPVAHAQGGFISSSDNPASVVSATGGEPSPLAKSLSALNALINFAKESTIALKVDPQSITLLVNTTILDESELDKSATVKIMKASSPSTPIDAKVLTDAYNLSLNTLKENLSSLQEALNKLGSKKPAINTIVKLDNLEFQITSQLKTADLKNIINSANVALTTGAPAKARDAARKADLNNVIAAIESYNSVAGGYPTKSDCLENISPLFTYFKKGTVPVDANGPQQIGTHNCQSGYYYQYAEKGSYALWGKMELNEDGNTDLTPEDWPAQFLNFSSHKGGQYYILSMLDTNSLQNSQPRPKVKRLQ